MVTAEELLVKITPEGVGETRQELEGVEQAMEDTADSAGDSAEQLEGFSQKFAGAMTAAVAALAIGAAGLLSQVPVLGEAFAGLGAVVDAIAFQMDGVLRPAMSTVTTTLFEIANAIFEADGSMGQLVGRLGTVASGAGLLVGALLALGVTITGPIAAAIAIASGLVVGLWTAWQTNFANIRGVVESTMDRISGRFQTFVDVAGPIINDFITWASEMWDEHGAFIERIINQAFNVIAAVVETVIDTILTVIQVGLQVLSGDWEGAWESITNFFGRMISLWGPIIEEGVSIIWEIITGLGEALVNWAGSLAEDAYDWGVSLIQGLIDGILSLTESVVQAVEDVVNDIIETINTALDNLPEEVTSRVGVESFEQVDLASTIDTTSSAESTTSNSAVSQTSTNVSLDLNLDGRSITEDTGRYRSDSSRRRGL